VVSNPDHPASVQFRALARILTDDDGVEGHDVDGTEKDVDGDRRGGRRLKIRR
jgi:hypothetical protein